MLLPRACPICDAPGPAPCAECWKAMKPAPPATAPDGTSRCRSLLAYAGPGRELVARLKYRNRRSALRWLAGAMANLIDPVTIDVVTWAPTTQARIRERGFDHAEVLARAIGRRLRRPVRPLILRTAGGTQTGKTRVERRAGPAFTARRHLSGARVLLVDDVVTTGATLGAAATCLRAAGAFDVVAVTAARTPGRHRDCEISGPCGDAESLGPPVRVSTLLPDQVDSP